MRTKNFLLWGGGLLAFIGIAGLVGILGPGGQKSLLAIWYLTTAGSLAYIATGVIAVIAAFILPESKQKWLAAFLGVAAFILTVLKFIEPGGINVGDFNDHSPLSGLFYFFFGLWAIWAAKNQPSIGS